MLKSEVNLAAPLRVVLAGGDATSWDGTRSALHLSGLVVVAECSDGASATAATIRERADVCVLRADLLGGAIRTASAIVSLPLAPKVVVLASTLDAPGFFAALRAGAAGYVLDGVESDRLGDDVRAVASGGVALSPRVAACLIEDLRLPRGRRAAPAGLTDREWEVLELVAAGLSGKEIALRLRIPLPAVPRHLSSAVKRIAAAGRVV